MEQYSCLENPRDRGAWWVAIHGVAQSRTQLKQLSSSSSRTWNQPRCPSTDEWIKKLWYIYTMDYYSAIQRNTFESVLMRWTKLWPIIQSEVRKRNINIIYWHIYMESEEMALMNLFSGKQWRNRPREQIYGHSERRGGRRGDVWKE